MSDDSVVVEVYRRRTLITSHKVDRNFGGVGHPNLYFGGFSDTHDAHSCCTTATGLGRRVILFKANSRAKVHGDLQLFVDTNSAENVNLYV